MDEPALPARRRHGETFRAFQDPDRGEIYRLRNLDGVQNALDDRARGAFFAALPAQSRAEDGDAQGVGGLQLPRAHHGFVLVQRRQMRPQRAFRAARPRHVLRDRRQDVAQHAAFPHETERFLRMPVGEEAEHFLADARHGGRQNAGMVPLDGRPGLLFDLEAEARRELDRPHHAHRVFLKADVRVAYRADDLLLEIVHPAHPVDDAEVADVVEQPVDREIAAVGVRLGRAEGVVLQRPLRGMFQNLADGLRFAAERRRLDHLVAVPHVRQAKTPADQKAVPERAFDLVGLRRRAHVEILRGAPHQQIAHAPADQIGRVAQPGQMIKHTQRVGIYILARYAMFPPRVHDRKFRFLFPEQKHPLYYTISAVKAQLQICILFAAKSMKPKNPS